MGALLNSKCYLSSAIECDTSTSNWRQEIIAKLSEEFGVITYDPAQDIKQTQVHILNEALEAENYDLVEQITKKFTKKDFIEIDRCSFLIASIKKNVQSTGVPTEVVHAINLKKPVLICSYPDKKSCPKWYFGNLHHKYIFGKWDDLFTYLKEVDEFKHRDNHRWWYTYKML